MFDLHGIDCRATLGHGDGLDEEAIFVWESVLARLYGFEILVKTLIFMAPNVIVVKRYIEFGLLFWSYLWSLLGYLAFFWWDLLWLLVYFLLLFFFFWWLFVFFWWLFFFFWSLLIHF